MMDLQPLSVPIIPHERALRLIKKVKIPKIEIKLINPACHFEDEIEEASHATPEATSAPQGSHKQQIHSPSATKPARRPKLPPPSTHKQRDQPHRKVVDPAEAKKTKQHSTPKKEGPREYVNIAKPVHIFPPSSSSGSQPAPGNNNNNAVAEEMSVGSIIISELPMRTVSLSSNITSMSNNRKSAPPKKSGFVNQFLALKDKSEFINQNYGSSQSKTFSTSPTSPRSPKDPHHGIPAVDASNLQKLDALTFGVKVEEYPALNKAIRAVSPKRPPVVQKPTGSFVDMVMDDSGRAIGGNEGHQAGNETAVLQEGSVATVIYIPSPHRPSFGELVDSDSVFNSGAHSPAVLEPPVLDMDNEFNMSPWGVMNEPAEGGGDKEEYVGETEEKGEVDKEVIEVSDQESEVIEEIDEAIEESLDESIS